MYSVVLIARCMKRKQNILWLWSCAWNISCHQSCFFDIRNSHYQNIDHTLTCEKINNLQFNGRLLMEFLWADFIVKITMVLEQQTDYEVHCVTIDVVSKVKERDLWSMQSLNTLFENKFNGQCLNERTWLVSIRAQVRKQTEIRITKNHQMYFAEVNKSYDCHQVVSVFVGALSIKIMILCVCIT